MVDYHEKGESSTVKRRTTRGGEDIDVTDKLTMTWVCNSQNGMTYS
jgi:hypothetical protein